MVEVEAPEQVDAYRVESLHQWNAEQDDTDDESAILQRVRHLLPAATNYYSDKITIPIQSIQDARNVIRSLFRLNSVDVNMEEDSGLRSQDMNRRRRDEAFAKLKYLNELRETRLRELQERHEANSDRTGVRFHVGQVVQHRQERWRGVVVDWVKRDARPPTGTSQSSSSSLTAKHYESKEDPPPRYSILLDEGDAQGLLGRMDMEALETELECVLDHNLVRIRNRGLYTDFLAFDSISASFLPNPLKRYEYPSDNHGVYATHVRLSTETKQLCEEVVHGVRDVAGRLVSILLENSKHVHPRSQQATTHLWRILKRIEEGDVLPNRGSVANDDISCTSMAALHVRLLSEATDGILDSVNQRRLSLANKANLKFRVGDIVWHTKFKFRGVIVAWDAKPSIDVSGWDGLTDVKNPMELPFYQVVPDPNDCLAAFGGKRGIRYVCEANLETCHRNRLDISVTLGHDWMFPEDGGEPFVLPPVGLRFSYGEDVGDNGLLEQNMNQLEDEINQWQQRAQCEDQENLSIMKLMELLGVVETYHDAIAIQDLLKDIRKANEKISVRQLLDSGLSSLIAGQSKEARSIFEQVVQIDPTYPEAWARIGIYQLLDGKYDDAEKSLKKALELDPSHLSANNSLGLLYFQKRNFDVALAQLRRCMYLDPWSPVTTRLSLCLDIIEASQADGGDDKSGH